MIRKFFFDSKFWSGALRLALPIALQNLLVSSYALVDILMVGQLGDVSLSAVGMAGQWNWLMNIIIFGICSGAAVFFAQYWGTGDRDGIDKIYGISLVATCLISLLFCLTGATAAQGVIKIFNRDPVVVDVGVRYLQIAAFSYPAAAVNMLFCTLLRSTERVRLPMLVAFFTSILNAVLDYALIFGAFGLPELGVEGAAIATCISAWSGPVLLLALSFFEKNMLIAPINKLLAFSMEDVKCFFIKAAPVIFNEGMWGLGTLCYNVIFSNMGYEYYAAVTILKTFENLIYVFFVGMCNACCVMVGKAIGGGDIKQGVADAKRFTVIIPVMAAVLGLFVILFRNQLVGLFNLNQNITQKTIESATMILLIYGLHMGVRNIPYIQIVGIFRSGGDTVTGVKYDLLCLWLIALPVTFVSAYFLHLPFVAVYALMYLCEDYVKSILCLKHFKSMKWIQPVTCAGKEGLATFQQQKQTLCE